MKVSDCKLGFVGFGHMAQVIYQAIEHAKLIPRSQISFIQRDPGKMKQNEQKYGLTSTSLERLVETSDLIILGVRPQQAHLVLEKLPPGKPLISLLAGVKIAYFQEHLGSETPILRVMPNIASAVGEGMSVFTYSPQFPEEIKSAAHLIFGCMGQVMEVSEPLADIACGIAGSGPGFVFRLIEAMARTGEKEGLSYETALKMAAQVFVGAGRLVAKGSLPETLIQQIGVPNGVTVAGFESMRQTRVDEHFQEAILAAAKRSKALSQEIK